MHISLRTQESIDEIADSLREKIKADLVAVVSRHGLHIASSGFPATNYALDATIAMMAMAFGAAETAEANMERLPPSNLIIEGEKENTVITGAGPKALLVARNPKLRLGDRKQMEEAAQEIKMLLG